ncbi:MAG: hypothetical protein IKW46_07265 [Bacteroidaceae bacterium]|nr:hypothetical protein [Bacteroidaceae bacterium]
MNKLKFIALLTIFSMSCLNSSAQSEYKVFEKQKKLTEARNRHKPQGVSRGFKKLYKKEYGLSKVQLPFNSFTSIYPGYEFILLHRNDYIGTMNNPIALASSDGDCIVYIPVMSKYADADAWMIPNLKKGVAVDVKCNKDDINYWQVRVTENDVNRIIDENVTVYEGDSHTAQCEADVMLLCKFPNREKICTYGKGGYISIHEEYPHYYTLDIYKEGHKPIKMHLFVNDNGSDKIDSYLSDICGSLKF